jgi:uncharacterized membrane protein YfcA
MVMALTWLGALVVGLSLGLLGSGGSILTVPVLVYAAHEPPKLAIAASLAIVGAIAFAGAANYARQGLVDWRYVLYFGLPGIIATYAGAWASDLVTGAIQLVVFAVVMALASWSMLRSTGPAAAQAPERHYGWLLAAGVGIGLITGFVGVGGGFLFVPALVILGGVSMHRAVGTSLAIILLNSASGFYGHFELLAAAGIAIPWTTISVFAAIGIVGSLLGNLAGRRLAHAELRRVFGVFLVAMSAYMLWHNLPQVI